MKKLILSVFSVIVFLALNAQNKYDYIGIFGEYQENWAKVQVNNKYGFIDKDGKQVVEPAYDYVGIFGEYQASWALVKADGK